MIKEKRATLEQFIKEQLIGPGGCNYRYSVFHTDDDVLNPECAYGEVLNTTPGSIYSSAILFPLQSKEDIQSSSIESNETDTAGNDYDDEDGINTNEDEIDEEKNFDHAEDIYSLGRRFPNKLGISCCLKESFANDSLRIVVSGRYYKKIKLASTLRIKVDDPDGFKSFINSDVFIKNVGKLVSIEHAELKIANGIPAAQLKQVRDGLREVNKYYCSKIATNQDGSICSIYNEPSFKPEYRFLSAYKERLFAKLNNFDLQGNYTCAGMQDEVQQRILEVEKIETYISYIEDVISVFDGKGFGYWEAIDFSKEIDLSGIDLTSKRVFKAEEHESLKGVINVDINEAVHLSLDVWLQSIRNNGKLYLKVLLVNSSTEITSGDVRYFSIVNERINERSFFGVSIDISSPHLIEYHKENRYDANDQEANQLRFLYRSIKDYGVGHLCSVNWGLTDGVMHVWSEFLPKVETPDVEPIPRNKYDEQLDADGKISAKPYLNNPSCLQFKWLSVLSNVSNEEIKTGLLDFIDSYGEWIKSLCVEGNEIAKSNRDNCQKDYLRIRNNIEGFLSDDLRMQSFRLMNTAMFMQLWHNSSANKAQLQQDKAKLSFDYYKDKADDTTIFPGVHAAWRPFQLAFILLNLDGIFRRDDNQPWYERNELVDLVWFPTGGGKTEAYLGIIALTIINRRKVYGQKGYGTAALMRYTLRLLTTQQFQRALRLIMALEQIRLWNKPEYGLGNAEISIGLYVGSASLPNTNKDLIEETQNWAKTHGKVPLDLCPWCGSPIDPITKNNEQHFRCHNPKCTFGGRNAYPVRLCDEHIYNNPPTLLFGTVDKFAQLAHKVDSTASKDSRRLFHADGCLPPDLIIQDELHLLLGPLGSAVSLYECAIDELCSYKDKNGNIVRPKIISSTATTRNTSLQIRALYDRSVSIFPKNGVDYDDSFFAFYKRYKNVGDNHWTYIAKRKYIGVLPTGRTQMTTQIRLAAILFVHRALFELHHIENLYDTDFIKAADYYYTVISYFNSLKEVGKTDAQFYQEFTKYTRRLFKRVLRFSNMQECLYAYNDHFKKSELTGRLTGEEAVKELANAQNRQWDSKKRIPFQDEQGNWHHAQLPADMVLATNMISVGLDVSRFNTIIMNSMPRNIAEYIQASSRVAREKEGLVITLHNPFNQRDVSHFEKFREFHEKLYFYVEPISITPFSPKSVERFLPLYLAAIIRQKYDGLGNRKDAGNINQTLSDRLRKELKGYFSKREERSRILPQQEASLLTHDMLVIIHKQIDNCIDIWLDAANQKGQNLVYYISKFGRRNPSEVALFASPEDFEGDAPIDKWLVPNALRVIEPESVIHVIR